MHRSIASKRGARAALVVGLVACSANRALANLTIIPTFDASITGDPNAAGIEAGINAAIAQVDGYIATPMTVNITFVSSGAVQLGQSTFYRYNVTYSDYKTSLATQQVLSADDVIAQASLPASTAAVDGNANALVTGTTTIMRALGHADSLPPAGQPDGIVTLNLGRINISRTGPKNGAYSDLESVALHEISEVLGSGGTGSLVGVVGADGSVIGGADFYRYTAPGVRTWATNSQLVTYFSIDGGVTNFVHFNQTAGGDYGDYASGDIEAQYGNTPPLVQDAFSTGGVSIDLGPVELAELDALGWNLTPAGQALEAQVVPEPACIGVIAVAAMGLLARRKRHARQVP